MVRHLFAAYDLAKDQLYGHIKKTKNRSKFLEFCRYLRSLHPANARIAIVCDNYSPHLTTKRCLRVETWAAANNVFRLRTGIPWRDLPTRFGKWQTVYDRHRRWSADAPGRGPCGPFRPAPMPRAGSTGPWSVWTQLSVVLTSTRLAPGNVRHGLRASERAPGGTARMKPWDAPGAA